MPQDILYEILENLIANISTNIHPAKCEILWTSLDATILDELNKMTEKNLQLLLNLFGQAIEYKNGKLLQNSAPAINMLKKLISHESLSEELILTATKIAIVILLSTNIKLPQDQASSFVRHILSLNKKGIFLYFVEHMSNYGSFEALILPAFLRHCIESDLDRESFHVMTNLILKKSPLSCSGINLKTWKKYTIDFNGQIANMKIQNKLIQYIKLENNEIDNYVCSLICLPHLILSNIEEIASKLHQTIQELCHQLDNENFVKKHLFLLNCVLETAVHLNIDIANLNRSLMKTLLPYASNVSFVTAIKTLDLYFTALEFEENIVNNATILELNSTLINNFDSPYHQVSISTVFLRIVFLIVLF